MPRRKKQSKEELAFLNAMTDLLNALQAIAAERHVCRLCLAFAVAEQLQDACDAGIVEHDGSDGFQPERGLH